MSQDEEILDLDMEATPMEEDDEGDILTLVDEPAGQPEETPQDEEILDLDMEATPMEEDEEDDLLSLLDEPAEEPISEPAASAASSEEDHMMLLFDEEETPESDSSPAAGEAAPSPRAADLLENGYELGEALDEAIDRAADSPGQPEADAETYFSSEEGTTGGPATGEFPVSPQQLNAALERVIEKKLGEKIDRLLAMALEKAVSNEIERLKRRLIKP
jgi:hypothetical protein